MSDVVPLDGLDCELLLDPTGAGASMISRRKRAVARSVDDRSGGAEAPSLLPGQAWTPRRVRGFDGWRYRHRQLLYVVVEQAADREQDDTESWVSTR